MKVKIFCYILVVIACVAPNCSISAQELKLEEVKSHAESGLAIAQYILGEYYLNGLKGLETDYNKAFYWLQKAVENGEESAQCDLGVCYFGGFGVTKDEKKGIFWLVKAAKNGDSKATDILTPIIMQEDDAKTYYYSSLAAQQEYAPAQWVLGVLSLMKNNYKNAVPWLQKAANQGYPEAQYDLAYCYSRGYGVPLDSKKKDYYLKEAKNNGYFDNNDDKFHLLDSYSYEEALQMAEQMSGKSTEEMTSHEKILWVSGINGDPDGQYYIANNYYLRNQQSEAIKWYQKAAEQGHTEALKDLAECYEMGRGVAVNKKMAMELYKRAAEKGDKHAQFVLDLEKESPLKQEMQQYSALGGIWYCRTNHRLKAFRITLNPSRGSVKFELWVGHPDQEWATYPDAHYVSPGQIYVNGGGDFGKVTFRLSGNTLVGTNGKTYYK